MMARERTDLDAAEILAACIDCVPVNARVDQAITAHRIAFKASEQDPPRGSSPSTPCMRSSWPARQIIATDDGRSII